MNARLALTLGLMGLLALSACDRAKPRNAKLAAVPTPVSDTAAAAALPVGPTAPSRERPGPVKWDPSSSTFQVNGQRLRAEKQWSFDGATDGFVATNGEVLPADGSGLALAETGVDSALRSPRGLNIDGKVRSLLIVRVTRVRPGQNWDGSVHYATSAHGESEQYLAKVAKEANPAVNETVTLVYDMHHLRRGEGDWKGAVIDQIRIDFDDSPGGAFVIHQIAVAQDPGGVAWPYQMAPKPPEGAKPAEPAKDDAKPAKDPKTAKPAKPAAKTAPAAKDPKKKP